MLTKITEFAFVELLLVAAILWRYTAHQAPLLNFIVCGGSLLAVYHAIRAPGNYVRGKSARFRES